MCTSYHAAILDHLAECMLYLSTASSFWFSLNSAHGRSIQIKAKAWRKFHGGRRFVINDCPIEFEQKKIDLDAYISGVGGHEAAVC